MTDLRRPRRAGGHTSTLLLVALAVVALSLVPTAAAFGAGNIPAYSYLEGKAFRHGDIEDILAELAKKAGGSFLGLGGGSKFGGLDIKRIYFGNWLRDYSQAMDVAGLSKMQARSILNIVMVLGFLAHGYATGSFLVTDERLGVYLPVEHIDNPKGYAAGEDARKYDPRLRGPVDEQRELAVDPRSGMKAYIAMEGQGFDTSSAFVRRTLIRCIEMGRQSRRSGQQEDEWEAYRLLGQGLHTIEDFSAHSNFCELALVKLGHRNVFCHVGANVRIRAPDGTQCAPLVTGTFGGADFMHSMLGEAQDHMSEASISDLTKAVDGAKSRQRGGEGGSGGAMQSLFGLLSGIPGGGGSNTTRDAEELSRGPARDPASMSPQEVYENLFKILSFRDRVMMSIETTIEKIPGMSALVEKITNALSVFVLSLLEPYMKPLAQQAMGGLHQTSAAVVSGEDQQEVFDNPNASDPTHSQLSKDHFGLILNETAGNLARIAVRHSVQLIVKAWDGEGSPDAVADECLAGWFHPNWYNPSRCHPVQSEMMQYMEGWARANHDAIRRLDIASCRAHTNTRSGKAESHSHGGGMNQGQYAPQGQQGYEAGTGLAHSVQGFVGNKLQAQGGILGAAGGFIAKQGQSGGGGGRRREVDDDDNGRQGGYNAPGAGMPEVQHHRYDSGEQRRFGEGASGEQQHGFEGRQQHHGSERRQQEHGYGSAGRDEGYGGRQEQSFGAPSYGGGDGFPRPGGNDGYPGQAKHGYGAPQQYGGAPQQYGEGAPQYGAPQYGGPQYGAPPPQGAYGGQYGPPQPGFGANPYPPQDGYGAPPPQNPYNQQGGSYGGGYGGGY